MTLPDFDYDAHAKRIVANYLQDPLPEGYVYEDFDVMNDIEGGLLEDEEDVIIAEIDRRVNSYLNVLSLSFARMQ